MKKFVFIFCCFISLTYCAGAQTKSYAAKVDSVKRSGYYNIALSTEMTAHLKTDYSDLRLLQENKLTPFALNPESDVMRETYLRKMKYSIAENNKAKTVIYTSADAFVNVTYDLLLTLDNLAVERTCSLSGSNDQQNWVSIQDSLQVYPFPGLTKNSAEIRIGFPPNSYQFFRLTIYNNELEPYQVNGMFSAVPEDGSGSELFQEVRMMQNPAVRFTQKDSGSVTYLKVHQPINYHFDRICYQLTGPKYFNRKAEIYLPVDGVQSIAFPGKKYASFSIIDNASFNVKIPVTNTRDLLILIYNEKDTPFHFTGITTALNQRYITAYLDSGKNYKLTLGTAGDETIPALKLRDNIIPSTLGFVKTGKLETIVATEKKAMKKNQDHWLRWIFVSAGLIVLLLAAFKFRANMNKKEKR